MYLLGKKFEARVRRLLALLSIKTENRPGETATATTSKTDQLTSYTLYLFISFVHKHMLLTLDRTSLAVFQLSLYVGNYVIAKKAN